MELLLLPYDSARGKSLAGRLISELEAGGWDRFRAAVAYARASGRIKELLAALAQFVSRGGSLTLTFGADTFGPEAEGSDYETIKSLVQGLAPYPTARVYLYREPGRSFHPKVYLFDSEVSGRALLIVGSSNWSHGGLFGNIEASLVVPLDLTKPSDVAIYRRLSAAFESYWSSDEEE